MQLIQIGAPQTAAVTTPSVSIREMFERMAMREASMVREARERLRSARAKA